MSWGDAPTDFPEFSSLFTSFRNLSGIILSSLASKMNPVAVGRFETGAIE